MESISAKKFYYEFIECIKNGTGLEKESWQESRKLYNYSKKYTRYINKELVPHLLSRFSGGLSNEYYRFDVSAWEQKKNEAESICKRVKMNPHLWDFKIAFEHENKINDWFDEAIKLLFIDCPLKVVVCYNKYSKRFKENDAESDCSKMNALCEIVNKLPHVCEHFRNKEFLIVIGNGGKGKLNKKYFDNTGKDFFGYKGYLLFVKEERVVYDVID